MLSLLHKKQITISMNGWIDWASEIRKFHYAKETSNITIADVKGQPKAIEALTVGSIKSLKEFEDAQTDKPLHN